MFDFTNCVSVLLILAFSYFHRFQVPQVTQDPVPGVSSPERGCSIVKLDCELWFSTWGGNVGCIEAWQQLSASGAEAATITQFTCADCGVWLAVSLAGRKRHPRWTKVTAYGPVRQLHHTLLLRGMSVCLCFSDNSSSVQHYSLSVSWWSDQYSYYYSWRNVRQTQTGIYTFPNL